MEVDSFIEYLGENPETFEWKEGKHENKPGIFVKNVEFDTKTHFSLESIKENDLELLISQTVQGKDVEHITRVTGFFSKVSSWNKGKRGELKERHRVDDINNKIASQK